MNNKPDPKMSPAGFRLPCKLIPVFARKPKEQPRLQPYEPRITFKHWEIESRWDYLYILWTVPRFLLIRVWFKFAIRWAKFWKDERLLMLIMFEGRHESIEPLWCERCLWSGRRKDAVHTYHSYGSDVEPADECPRCGGEI